MNNDLSSCVRVYYYSDINGLINSIKVDMLLGFCYDVIRVVG